MPNATMAEQGNNPFMEESKAPYVPEIDPPRREARPTGRIYGQEPMQIEAPGTDFRAVNWANDPIHVQGHVDPGTLPQLVYANSGMSLTSEEYIVRWQSHADHKAAWDFINLELDIEHYVKIYTSTLFEMKPDMRDHKKKEQLDWVINSLAIKDQRHARWGIVSCDITNRMDVVLGLRDKRKAINLIDNGWMILPVGTEQPLPLS